MEKQQGPSLAELSLEKERASRARYEECVAMDWHPTPQPPVAPVSQSRAFAPFQPEHRKGQLFGQAPVAEEPSAFWYKVPPAPITPAHRLRNPPHQPHIQPASDEAKEKFFSPSSMGKSLPIMTKKDRQDFPMADQKFFPTTTQPVDEDALTSMMTGFSLGDDTSPPKTGFFDNKVAKSSLAAAASVLGLSYAAWYVYQRDTPNAYKSMYEVEQALRESQGS